MVDIKKNTELVLYTFELSIKLKIYNHENNHFPHQLNVSFNVYRT